LFIGALGRENVCCLKLKNVKEKPSDIDGILYKEFNNDLQIICPTTLLKLTEGLRKHFEEVRRYSPFCSSPKSSLIRPVNFL